MLKITLLFILSLCMFSCKTYNEDDKLTFDEKIEKYIKTEHLDLEKTSSGLYLKTLKEGDSDGEEIKYQSLVSFKYKGSLLNGEVFDEQENAVTFKISQLIGAWKEALIGKTAGTKLYLIAPPQLGYGDRDLDDIPPNSILVFELEVISVE